MKAHFKRNLRTHLLAGSLFAMVCLLLPDSASADEKLARLAKQMGWLSSYQDGLGEARQTGKPLFVVFRCQP